MPERGVTAFRVFRHLRNDRPKGRRTPGKRPGSVKAANLPVAAFFVQRFAVRRLNRAKSPFSSPCPCFVPPVRENFQHTVQTTLLPVRVASMMWSNTNDRRRRGLSFESQEPRPLDAEAIPPAAPQPATPHQAFESLSRDRLMRRLLSNRLWKHALLCLTFCGAPALLALILLLTTNGQQATSQHSSGQHTTGLQAPWLPPGPLWALTGLELFTSAQLCLLIATVRSASCIDFHGSYRSWKWLSGFLCGLALLTLSHSASATTGTLAWLLFPLTGPLQAARPALLIVPAASLLLVILRIVVPDMRHSRWAQGLLLCSALFSLVCVLLSTRLTDAHATLLSALSLTTSGFLLSAVLLHTRFVVHVNPNPPDASGSSAFKSAACAPSPSPLTSIAPAIAAPAIAATDAAATSIVAAVPTGSNVTTDQPPLSATAHAEVECSVPLRTDESNASSDTENTRPPATTAARQGKPSTKRTRKSA